jgi:hypothetical protein
MLHSLCRILLPGRDSLRANFMRFEGGGNQVNVAHADLSEFLRAGAQIFAIVA